MKVCRWPTMTLIFAFVSARQVGALFGPRWQNSTTANLRPSVVIILTKGQNNSRVTLL